MGAERMDKRNGVVWIGTRHAVGRRWGFLGVHVAFLKKIKTVRTGTLEGARCGIQAAGTGPECDVHARAFLLGLMYYY